MPDENNPNTNSDEPMVYEIRLKGHLGRQWESWFGSLTIILEDDGNTLITCPVIDQAALHGLLRKLRDLGMPLISLNPVEHDESDVPDAQR